MPNYDEVNARRHLLTTKIPVGENRHPTFVTRSCAEVARALLVSAGFSPKIARRAVLAQQLANDGS
jgi:hypothetical protein